MKPLIILEFANNHMGDEQLFKVMVDEYAAVAQDFSNFDFSIKLQYRDLPSFVHKSFQGSEHPGVARFESTAVSPQGWDKRIDYAIAKGFIVGCTPFDEKSVVRIFSDERIQYLKIGSCSLTDWPFLESIRSTIENNPKNCRIIASTGGATLGEIDNVVSFLSHLPSVDLALMHCIAKYPSSTAEQNLIWIRELSDRYGVRVGLSTHEPGSMFSSAAFSACLGASIFEKHVVSENAKEVNKYSARPSQVIEWLQNLETAIEAIGSSQNRQKLFQHENTYLNSFRRGVYANTKIGSDEIINDDDVYFAFPAEKHQLTANQWSKYCKYRSKTMLVIDRPLHSESIQIVPHRQTIEELRTFVVSICKTASIALPKASRLEISHHYGLEHFNDYGLMMITFVNLQYCKKLMIQKHGQRHPEQFHKIKTETFVMLHGSIELSLDGSKCVMHPGDVVTISPGVIHSWTALSDCIIEEISSNHDADDSYYVDTAINSNKKRKSFISIF